MYEVVVVLKALVEVAAVGMFGQGVLHVLAGKSRETNLVYGLFKIITMPVMKLTRLLMPRIVLDRHIWMVAVLLLAVLWVVLTAYKINMAMQGAAVT